ncbi:MAG: peptidyl-prolyl cis-trans isomerase [Proteobacteria bacterium]|nr:peptidyl-prolyl cis-trans isomerase [Pseudomonadota bacterium]
MRRQVLSFVVGGLLLFAADVWVTLGGAAKTGLRGGTATLTAARVEALVGQYRRALGREPGSAERQALVEHAVTNEILYREALARGLDRNDSGVRFRLAEKMRFLAGEQATADERSRDRLYRQALELELDRDDLVLRRLLVQKMRLLLRAGAAVEQAGDERLLAWMRGHARDYEQPARVDLEQVFFSADGEGGADAARHRAERELVAAVGNARTAPAGDPFMPGRRFSNVSRATLARSFGPAFADSVMSLPADDLLPNDEQLGNWQGPVESAYGWHLVRVGNRRPARLPALDSVRSRLTAALANHERDLHYREQLAELREAWTIVVEAPR